MLVLSNSVKMLSLNVVEPITTDAIATASHIIASDRKSGNSNFFGYQAMEQLSQ